MSAAGSKTSHTEEEDPNITNGEDNQPHSTSQSEAVTRRSNNDYVEIILQQRKAALPTNRPSIARTQVGSTTIPAESDSSSRYSGQSNQYSRKEVQKNESKCSADGRIDPETVS